MSTQLILDKLDAMGKEQRNNFKELSEKIDGIVEEQAVIKTTLYGAKYEKDGGLCNQVKKNTDAINNIKLWIAGIGSVFGAIGGFLANFIKL
jgi:hypothetical protein